jgi:hypothetical protein
MADLKKILGKLKEEDPSGNGYELLPEDEVSELEGGHQSSCPINTSCLGNSGCASE